MNMVDAHNNGDCGSFCPACDIEDALEESRLIDRVHNHPPYRPVCHERRLSNGLLRGACLNDDGTPSEMSLSPASEGGQA